MLNQNNFKNYFCFSSEARNMLKKCWFYSLFSLAHCLKTNMHLATDTFHSIPFNLRNNYDETKC